MAGKKERADVILQQEDKRNKPENLDQEINGFMVGTWSSSVRLNADTVRGRGLCHGYSLLSHYSLFFLLLLLCVRGLILWRRWFHQPHVFTAFLHPMGDTVCVTSVLACLNRLIQAELKVLPSLVLANFCHTVTQKSTAYQRSLGVVSVGT